MRVRKSCGSNRSSQILKPATSCTDYRLSVSTYETVPIIIWVEDVFLDIMNAVCPPVSPSPGIAGLEILLMRLPAGTGRTSGGDSRFTAEPWGDGSPEPFRS